MIKINKWKLRVKGKHKLRKGMAKIINSLSVKNKLLSENLKKSKKLEASRSQKIKINNRKLNNPSISSIIDVIR